jgi:Protein of unknown function (DUF2889)
MSSESAERRHLHNRTVVFDGYLRSDGLWEIEAEIVDTKPYLYDDRERGALSPGHPIHRIAVRLTLDDSLTIRATTCDMIDTPFSICSEASAPVSALVGAQLGPGWRRAVDERMGGTKGCSHLRELLYNMATVAFQTISPYRERQGGQAPGKKGSGMPFFLDGCYSWALDSPIVTRFFPQHSSRK